MRIKAVALEEYLAGLAAQAHAGDRVPPVRELMAQFKLSQPVVQRAIHALQAQGAVQVQPGRGAFFVVAGEGEGAEAGAVAGAALPARTGVAAGRSTSAARSRSVLVLRRAVAVDRGRHFVEQLVRAFEAEGHRVIEVRFSDAAHARHVLKGLPRFDACVVQSVYHGIPSDLLAMIQEKSRVVAFDGVSMISEGMDSVGTEWGEPLAQAVGSLRRRGHRRLCFAATSLPLLATTIGMRRWEYLAHESPAGSMHELRLPLLPDEGYTDALVAALAERMDAKGALPFTGLIAWGVSDGALFREKMREARLKIPERLSVVLLGRTDQPSEHADFFELVGPRIADQVHKVVEAIRQRWADPAQASGVYLAPVTVRAGDSVATLRAATKG